MELEEPRRVDIKLFWTFNKIAGLYGLKLKGSGTFLSG